ncbi:radical SAM protein [bacterium]|nr:radical SAM protein [bacterium]
MKKPIEIADILPVSEVNGPGKRTVIWVQGCPKRCPGCWNPEFLTFGSDRKLTPKKLVEYVREATHSFNDIEGVTFSGGEPFSQAETLAEAAKLFRRHGLSIMSYSGWTLEEIQSSKSGIILLNQLDILIDGEYIRSLSTTRLWHSSSNQRVHFLTERYSGYRSRVESGEQEFEITLKSDEVTLTGFPDQSVLRALR